MIERGVTKSDIILTFSENTIELVIFLFASIFLGVTIYPVSPSVNVYEVDQLIESLGSIVFFTSKLKSEIMAKIFANKKKPNIKFVGILDGVYDNFVTLEQLLKEGKNKTLDTIPHFSIKSKEELFSLLQSSGTSGIPKSVMASHRAFVANLMTMINADFDRSQYTSQPSFCLMSPLACGSGLITLIGYLALGVRVVMYRDYDPELILKSIEKYRIDLVSFVPAFAHKLVSGDLVDKYDFSSVKLMATTGAAIPEHICKAIINKYKGVVLQEGMK